MGANLWPGKDVIAIRTIKELNTKYLILVDVFYIEWIKQGMCINHTIFIILCTQFYFTHFSSHNSNGSAYQKSVAWLP